MGPSVNPFIAAPYTIPPSALGGITCAHPELRHVNDRLRHLLTLADDAYRRYYQDWKLADANQRVLLLQLAFETAKPSWIDTARSSGKALVT